VADLASPTPAPRRQPAAEGAPVGLIYSGWVGDPLPRLEPRDSLATSPTTDPRLLASVRNTAVKEMAARLADGHHAYIARWDGEAVGFGWSATQRAGIGELGIHFELPPGVRYLWDFVTLAPWRGRGIYPRLLQAILEAESREASRFWIGHDLENLPSRQGILAAGFTEVAAIHRLSDGQLVLEPRRPMDRAAAAAALMGVRAPGEKR
jgi:GNAT superfamily N-acetyltransferase